MTSLSRKIERYQIQSGIRRKKPSKLEAFNEILKKQALKNPIETHIPFLHATKGYRFNKK